MTIAQRNQWSRFRGPHRIRRRADVVVSEPEGEG